MLSVTKIEEAIDAFIASDPPEDHHITIPPRSGKRNYLGLSGLGDECARAVWYGYRECVKKTFPMRLHRLFRRGDREEFVFVWLLRGIGFTVHEKDAEGKQFKVTDFEGHLSGHMDGVGEAPRKFWIRGSKQVPFLLEFKTYNDKRFNELKKRGVRKSDPKYYGQMQGYMGYENLTGALFCAVNKNDDHLYFEWVPFKRSEFDSLKDKAEMLINAQTPPARISSTPSDFRCRYCDFKGVCHGDEPSQKTCRSCKFASPGPDASWECAKDKEFGTVCNLWKDVAK